VSVAQCNARAVRTVVLRGDEASLGALVDAGLVVSSVSIGQLVCASANGKGENLVACGHVSSATGPRHARHTEADAKHWLVVGVGKELAQVCNGLDAHLCSHPSAQVPSSGIKQHTAGSPGPLLMKRPSKSVSPL
jgi:hypothetical protein